MSNKSESILYKSLDKPTRHHIFKVLRYNYKQKPQKQKQQPLQ